MWSLLVTCEHASGAVPEGLDLGLSEAVLASHVSMDRGAASIARALAEAHGAPVHLGRFSRLVVDLNRREENPAVIVETTYGLHVPGNAALSVEARGERVARHHRPYRQAARADALARADAGGCLHLSIHSFDPRLDPAARGFDAGILFDPARAPEDACAGWLIDALLREGLDVRANAPYLGTPEGLTSWLREAVPQGRYVGVEVEWSQAAMLGPDEPGALARFAAALDVAARDALARLDARVSE